MSLPNSPSEHIDEVFGELKNRVAWEQKLARYSAQRNLQDRPRRALQPWPGASNVRFPLSATLIRKQKPILYGVVYNSANIAYFSAIKPENLGYVSLVAALYDKVVKLKTDFETQIQYGIDSLLQDGESIFKIVYDEENGVPIFSHVENLAFITPGTTSDIHQAPWVCEVLGMWPHEIKEKFSHIDEAALDEFIETVKGKAESSKPNDSGGKEKDTYSREGISQSSAGSMITLWEKHYMVGGSRRKMTLSPDLPDFDFQDDVEYNPWRVKSKRYMYEHHKIEYKSKHMHDVMGYPEMVQEFEHLASAIWRLKHNLMALMSNPILFHPTNQPPGSTQNFIMQPGAIAPYPLQKLEFGEPPISLDGELQHIREVVEQYVGRADYGIGDANTQNAPRTKFEIQQISSVQNMVVNMDVGNWKRYIARILEQGWLDMAENKPQIMNVVTQEGVLQIPPQALNADYSICITTSAESINRESETQKAASLLQAASQPAVAPYANFQALFKNLVEKVEPLRVQEFMTNPQNAQVQVHDKALSDLAIMLTTGEPIQAKPNEDYMNQAVTAVKFLQKMYASQTPLTQLQAQLVAGYIASNREALKQINHEAYLNLSEILNQLDQAAHTVNRSGQPAPAGVQPPTPLPPQPQAMAA